MPAFANATYWSHSRHWKWATAPNEREKASFLKENIQPIEASGQLRFVDTGQPAGATAPGSFPATGLETLSDIILPGLSVRLVNGHTDAMMLPQLRYKGKTLVFVADLLPSTGHFPTAWVMAYDMFPLTSLQEKRSFLEEAAAGGYVLFFEHDAHVECSIPEKTEKGFRPGTGFTVKDL